MIPPNLQDHLIDAITTGLALGGLAFAAVLDATQSPIGLPGAEYIGMFGVVWLLFRNLDKRESNESKHRSEETMARGVEREILEALRDAIHENPKKTKHLQQMIAKTATRTAAAVEQNADALEELTKQVTPDE